MFMSPLLLLLLVLLLSSQNLAGAQADGLVQMASSGRQGSAQSLLMNVYVSTAAAAAGAATFFAEPCWRAG
jgi:hypothetical protein